MDPIDYTSPEIQAQINARALVLLEDNKELSVTQARNQAFREMRESEAAQAEVETKSEPTSATRTPKKRRLSLTAHQLKYIDHQTKANKPIDPSLLEALGHSFSDDDEPVVKTPKMDSKPAPRTQSANINAAGTRAAAPPSPHVANDVRNFASASAPSPNAVDSTAAPARTTRHRERVEAKEIFQNNVRDKAASELEKIKRRKERFESDGHSFSDRYNLLEFLRQAYAYKKYHMRGGHPLVTGTLERLISVWKTDYRLNHDEIQSIMNERYQVVHSAEAAAVASPFHWKVE